jgi:MFS family permease
MHDWEGGMVARMTEAGSRGKIAGLLGPYSVLRGNRGLRLLYGGQVVSAFGDRVYIIVVLVMAFNLTHSATVVALLNLMRLLPNALVLPLAGAAADRLHPKWLMIGADAGRGVCMLGLLAAGSRNTLWLAFPLVFVTTCFLSLFRPALNSALPGITGDDDKLMQANSLMSQVDALAWVIGPAMAGFLVLFGDLRFAFLINAGTYLISIAAMLFVTVPPRPADTRPADEAGWIATTLAGFRFVFRENEGVLGAVTIPYAGFQMYEGASWALMVVLSVDVWHFGNQGIGFINTAYGIGGVLGGLAAGAVVHRIHPGSAFIGAVAGRSLLAVLFGLSPTGALPYITLGLMGAADVMALIVGVTVIQTSTPRNLLGRSFSAFESTSLFSKVLGTILAAPLIALAGPRFSAVLFAIVALLLLAPCIPRLRRLHTVVELRLFLRRVPMLADLSRVMLDDLALHLRLEQIPHDATIVRQGDVGDRFYLIKSGEATVLESDGDGREIELNVLRPMDYFGEIALLREVPRVATVRARGEVQVFSLMRVDFQNILGRSEAFRKNLSRTADARYLEAQSTLRMLR